jgi:hypothetical protein
MQSSGHKMPYRIKSDDELSPDNQVGRLILLPR